MEISLSVPAPAGGLRGEILAVVDESTGPLGFRPQVRFGGPVDASGGDDLDAHVVGVVREGLANVARHARAGRALVEVEVGTDLLVRITDDGIGAPTDPPRRSGLANLRSRAVELGGTSSVRPAEGGGTVLEWRVPLAGPSRRP